MAFFQILEFTATDIDAFKALEQEYLAATEGKRTARRAILLQDRNDPTRYLDVVVFDSYESAMENSALPETQAISQRIGGIVEGLTFRDLEVVSDREW